MRTSLGSHCIFVAAVALGLSGATASRELLAAEQRPAPLKPEQLREQAALLAEFRKAKGDQDERLKLIDRAAEHSVYTLKNVLEVIGKELNRPLADYRQQFSKGAAELIGRRASPVNLQQVAELRSRVLALSKNEGLTKEQIVAVGDPALAQLKQIMLIQRDEVLAANPELAPKREALGRLGQLWERGATLMIKALDEASESSEKAQGAANGDRAEPIPPPSFEAYLMKEEEIAAALAVPMPPATRAVLAANSQLAARIDAEEARCVLDLNLTRNLLGLAPVQIDLALTAVARDHSADMERLNFFSHDSPVPGKATPWDRAKRGGTTASGENIAAGMLDGAVANLVWWHSPGHHRNMLGDHKRVGIGRSGKHWTELFGK